MDELDDRHLGLLDHLHVFHLKSFRVVVGESIAHTNTAERDGERETRRDIERADSCGPFDQTMATI